MGGLNSVNFFAYTFSNKSIFLCHVRSGGPTICEDVDGAPVVEPTHSSTSGHLQSKLSTCPYCRSLFTADRELCDHIRTQHADRHYSCLQCTCTFGSTSALNRHVRNEHQKLVKFRCRTFMCTGGLNRHVRNVHQKLVKFRCQICGKGYDDRRNYHDHMATHAGVKRNVCTICQAQFTFRRSLKARVMHLHPPRSKVQAIVEVLDGRSENAKGCGEVDILVALVVVVTYEHVCMHKGQNIERPQNGVYLNRPLKMAS